MKPLGKTLDHYWKVQKMAKATGVDLVEAFDAGDLTSDQWAGVVSRCRQCGWLGGCEAFLDGAEEGQEAPPRDCVNHKVFEALKP